MVLLWLLLAVAEALSQCDPCNLFPSCLTYKQTCKSSWVNGLDNGWDTSLPLIDETYMSCMEAVCLGGYVPLSSCLRPIDKSGITVARGFDLSKHDVTYLNKIGLSQSLITKLSKFMGLRANPVDYVQKHPLVLTQSETTEINSKVTADYLTSLQAKYNTDSNTTRFENLPRGIRTAIFSVYYQLGGPSAYPKLWKYVTAQQWSDAIAELRDFGGNTVSRREKDADIMAAALLSCNTNGYYDISIVLDESGSIMSSDFEKARSFVLQMIDHFTIGRALTQVAFMTFSTAIREWFTLNKYTNKTAMEQVVKSVVQAAQNTNTGIALQKVVSDFLTPANGERSQNDGYSCITLVMTDGGSTDPGELVVSAPLLKKVCTVQVIGFGSGVNMTELNFIASEPRYVYMMSDYTQLLASFDSMQRSVCLSPIQLQVGVTVHSSVGLASYKYFILIIDIHGATIVAIVITGDIALYGSFTNTNPTEFSYDFKADGFGNKNLRIDAQTIGGRMLQTGGTVTAYFSVVGVNSTDNQFNTTVVTGILCDNGNTVATSADCNPTVQCGDGTIVATLADCPLKCTNGTIVANLTDCLAKCSDGTTVANITDCPPTVKCADGTTVANLTDCPVSATAFKLLFSCVLLLSVFI